MTVEEAQECYGTATYLDQVPAYTQLPVSGHTRTLARHLGFVSLQIASTGNKTGKGHDNG